MASRTTAITLVAAALLAVFVLSQSDDPPTGDERAAPQQPTEAHERGCRERVEGGRIAPDPRTDTVIGPVSLVGLPAVYRDQASRPDSPLQPRPGVGMPAIKVIALVRAGTRVTLAVPREQRPWMRLLYRSPIRGGEHAIALRACRRLESLRARQRECGWRPNGACRWRNTQFSGGFALDFAAAPRRGRCAELIAWVEGRERPLREPLFAPEPRECGRAR